jgi:formiminoglutamase
MKTEKWWMEVEINQELNEKITIPCSKNDYLMSSNSILPLRWWKAYKKFY